MRATLTGLILALATLPAWAQTRDKSLCMSRDRDVKIGGCTALIRP